MPRFNLHKSDKEADLQPKPADLDVSKFLADEVSPLLSIWNECDSDRNRDGHGKQEMCIHV